FAQELWKLAEAPVPDGARRAVQGHQPRAVALAAGDLGDQLRGELEVEVVEGHRGRRLIARPGRSVQLLKLGPRVVVREDLTVALSGVGHRLGAPLAQPRPVAEAPPYEMELAVLLHGDVEVQALDPHVAELPPESGRVDLPRSRRKHLHPPRPG